MKTKFEGPLPGEIEEAKRNPDGWVYRIAGKFQEEERVPPEAIIGAWKVDNRGCIVDGFARNENYDSQRWPFVLNKGTEGGMREGACCPKLFEFGSQLIP